MSVSIRKLELKYDSPVKINDEDDFDEISNSCSHNNIAEQELKKIKEINESCMSENYEFWLWKYFVLRGHVYILEKTTDKQAKIAEIIGYIMLIKPTILFTRDEIEEKLLKELNNFTNIFIIGSIAVVKKERGNKYGQMLLEHVIKNMKNAAFILNVRISNLNAIHIYEKNGFVKYDVIKEYYKNPTEDSHVMYLKNEC